MTTKTVNIVFERRGHGEPLLLLHGTGGSHRVWDPLQPFLTDHRDVIAVDLPGFGASPALPVDRVTNAAVADKLAELLDSLDVDRPHVAGTSLGGHVALELGSRGLARSVVAFSPTGFWTAREARYVRSLVAFLRTAAIANRPLATKLATSALGRQMLLGTSYHDPSRVSPEAAVEAVEALARCPGFAAVARAANRERLGGAPATSAGAAERLPADVRDGLDRIPVTIGWAEHDRFLNPRQAKRAERALPSARHVLLRGCGHLATWDAPEQLAGVLLQSHVATAD